MFEPAFSVFFRQNLVFFITGGCIVLAGLVGAVLYVRKQGGK